VHDKNKNVVGRALVPAEKVPSLDMDLDWQNQAGLELESHSKYITCSIWLISRTMASAIYGVASEMLENGRGL
jgi:hypothetical protein